MNEKNFDEWNELKKELQLGKSMPMITEGDIWWCDIGINVGIEIDGKSKQFSRPVLIYKKLGIQGFIGIPLTTKHKNGSWYCDIDFQNKNQVAVLSQIRPYSVYRLSCRMGSLDDVDKKRVKDSLLKFLR